MYQLSCVKLLYQLLPLSMESLQSAVKVWKPGLPVFIDPNCFLFLKKTNDLFDFVFSFDISLLCRLLWISCWDVFPHHVGDAANTGWWRSKVQGPSGEPRYRLTSIYIHFQNVWRLKGWPLAEQHRWMCFGVHFLKIDFSLESFSHFLHVGKNLLGSVNLLIFTKREISSLITFLEQLLFSGRNIIEWFQKLFNLAASRPSYLDVC